MNKKFQQMILNEEILFCLVKASTFRPSADLGLNWGYLSFIAIVLAP